MIREPKTPPTDDPERKERVLHTRVPESLEAELRERAQGLGMSVSNLVRNVLGHAFGLVEGVTHDIDAIARAAARSTRPSTPPPAPEPLPDAPPPIADVLAWQPMILGKNAVCARCNELLPRGRDAAMGTTERTGARVIICPPCLEEVRQ